MAPFYLVPPSHPMAHSSLTDGILFILMAALAVMIVAAVWKLLRGRK